MNSQTPVIEANSAHGHLVRANPHLPSPGPGHSPASYLAPGKGRGFLYSILLPFSRLALVFLENMASWPLTQWPVQ